MTILTSPHSISFRLTCSSRARSAAYLLAAIAATLATTAPLRAGLSDSGDVGVDLANQLLIGNSNPGSHFNFGSIESYADVLVGNGAVGGYTLNTGAVATSKFIAVGWLSDGSLFATNSALASGSQIFTNGGLIAENAEIGVGGIGTVSMRNSSWQVVGAMTVGSLSDGSLTMDTTSTVLADYFYLGFQAQGTAKLTGPNTSITLNVNAVIGDFSAGNLTLDDEASFTTLSDLLSLGENTSGNGTITVKNHSTISVAGGTGFVGVGRKGTGFLTIQSGGTVTNGLAMIGEQADSVGTVTVEDASSWFCNGPLIVGSFGNGTLADTFGGAVQSTSAIVGEHLGSNGTVDIGDNTEFPALWNNSAGSLTIGDAGTGNVTIHANGTLTTLQLILGLSAGEATTDSSPLTPGHGSLTIDAGTVTISSFISVGRGGNGTLIVTNGGHLDSVDGIIGEQLGSSGQVTIGDSSGNPSLWNNIDGFLTIGNEGTGNVTVFSDGKITTAQIILGSSAGSGDPATPGIGTLTIDGGSVTASDFATIGNFGVGHLVISGGGSFHSNQGFVGGNPEQSDVFLSNTDSHWTIANDLTVGTTGVGYVDVISGSLLSSGFAFLGDQSGSNGRVDIDGTDATPESPSTWEINGDLNIGISGIGEVVVSNGGKVTADNIFLATTDPASTGNLFITDPNSSVIITGQLTVGLAGAGSFTVTNHADLQTNGAFIGQSNNTNNLGFVSDNATWTNIGDLTVGLSGGYGAVVSDSNATLHITGDVILGRDDGSTGNLFADNCTFTIDGNLTVGVKASAFLGISNTGSLSAATLIIGQLPGSSGRVNLQDPGSSLTIADNTLIVGAQGNGFFTLDTGASLTLDTVIVGQFDGGYGVLTVQSQPVFATASNGIHPNIAPATPTSTLTVNTLNIGSATSADAFINQGGEIIATDVILGEQEQGFGRLTIDAGHLDVSGTFIIAEAGTGFFILQNGGSANTTSAIVANAPNSAASINISSNATWTNGSSITLGGSAEASLVIDNGRLTTHSLLVADTPSSPDLVFALSISGATGSLTTDSLTTKNDATNIAVSLAAKLTSNTTILSANPGSSTVVNVNDASNLSLGTLTIGDAGFARINLLGIGTKLTATDAILGNQSGSQGILEAALLANTVNFSSTIIGKGGNGSILVTDANTLNLGDTDVAYNPGTIGTIVFNAGGKLTTASTIIAVAGTANVTLKNKVKFSSGDVTLAYEPGSDATLTLDTQSQWTSFGPLIVGHQGNATLNLKGGATAGVANASIADDANGTGFVNLQGTGTKLVITNSLTVGITEGTADSATLDIGLGAMVVAHDTTLNATGLIDGKGTLKGKLTNAGGTLAPGNSPGTLTIDGDYDQTAGLLQIQAADLTPGDYDQLLSTGNISIHGGTILFSFLDGFAPQTGDTFTFLDGSLSTLIDPATTTFATENIAPGFLFTVEPDASGGYQFRALNNAVATPEPTTLTLLLLPLTLLSRRRTRKN